MAETFDCRFCNLELVKRVSPTVLEDKAFLAFSDASPVSPGHTIIIPKEHFPSFFDLPEQLPAQLYEFMKSVKRVLDDTHHPNGYNLGLNEGRAAGRSVDHVHFHLIPRYEGDVENPRGGVRNLLGKPVSPYSSDPNK